MEDFHQETGARLDLVGQRLSPLQNQSGEFKTNVLNQAIRKALIRLVAKEEGILHSHSQVILGRRRDTIHYSFLKGKWPMEAQ